MNQRNTESPVAARPRSCVMAATMVVFLHSPLFGFEIFNDSPYSIRATVPAGDFDEVIPPGEMRSCHYSNTDCNPTGAQTAILSLIVETLDSNDQDFMATVELLAGAQAYVHRELRSNMGLEPLLYVDSWNVPGDALVDDSRLGTSQTERSIRFLASADCQYQHPGTTAAATDWPVADATNRQMTSMTLNKPNRIRGILYAGDLTQNARRDEWEHYKSQIGSMGEFFYDGMGNHDLANDRPCITTWPAGCTIRDEIAETIRDRKHRTTKTNKAPGDDPHYSWDWDDVHFVQLNLFPGDAPSAGLSVDDGGTTLDPANALTFLIDDLAQYVGSSGRPVVLIHHYGFDNFSIAGNWWTEAERVAYWNALAPYRVAGIITGHWHLQENSADWRFNWRRPAGASGGPTEIATFIAGGAIEGVFIDVEINDDDEMIVTRRFNDGRVLDSETVLFGPDDIIDRGAPNDTCATAFYLNGAEDLSDMRMVGEDEDWYGVLVPGNVELRVDMAFSHDAGDLDLYLYADCNSSSIASSISTDDNESVTWTNPGAATWVLVRAFQYLQTSGGTVDYGLTITIGEDHLEDNDTCATASPLAAGVHTQLNTESGDDDWYDVIIPAASVLDVNLSRSDPFATVVVEIWDDCSSGPIVTNSSSGPSLIATYINNAPERSVKARVYMTNTNGIDGYDLAISYTPVPTQTCPSAPSLPPGSYTGLTVFDGADDWFKISTVNNALTTVALDFTHADGNVDLELWDACGGIRLMSSESNNDDESLSYEGNGFGEVIYARVRMADSGGLNEYDLTISNQSTISGADNCADATPISGFREFVFNNASATIDGASHPLCHIGNSSTIDNDIWFDWTATVTGTVTMTTCDTPTIMDTKLAVYQGTDCTGPILACDDDTCNLQPKVTIDAVSGEQFKIRLGNYDGATPGSGKFRISVEDSYGPSVDDCTTAVHLAPGVYPDLVLPSPVFADSTDWWSTPTPPNTRIVVDVLHDAGVEFSPTSDLYLYRSGNDNCPGGVPGGVAAYSISGGLRIVHNNSWQQSTDYIRVRNFLNADGANYTLRITQTMIDDQLEPNDTCEAAASIVEGLYTDLRCGDDDYYAIAMPETSILDVDAFFAHADGDLSLLVYGPCDQPLTNSNTATDDESLSYVNAGPATTVMIRVVRVVPGALVPYALNVSVTDIDDCNANGIHDPVEIANQLSEDCNSNGIPDDCDMAPPTLSLNVTGIDDSVWLGEPDDNWVGIGTSFVTYNFGGARVLDGPGSDFNVYEADTGVAEFDKIIVLVKGDTGTFIDITATASPVVRIPGDEQHGNDAFARSYDIAASGLADVRYISVDGVGVTGPAGGTNGFDLDAIGAIYLAPAGCDVLFDGDMNCDGVVDVLDVSLFGTALISTESFALYEPICPVQRADVNRDGKIDGNDAQGFVDLLFMP